MPDVVVFMINFARKFYEKIIEVVIYLTLNISCVSIYIYIYIYVYNKYELFLSKK